MGVYLSSESKPAVRRYRFGDFELDLKSGELRQQGRKVKLQEQPFAILRMLLEHPGEVISKEELQNTVWPANTFVDFDHGLHAAIARVRDALADSAENPRFVETLQRRGYRFIAPVEEILAQPAPSAEPVAMSQWPKAVGIGIAGIALVAIVVVVLSQRLRRAEREPIRSVAVLPLLNLSGDPGKEYLADGVTDELITDLAQTLNMRVISRTSAMHYKGSTLPATQIGRELNVDALVEGSVVLDNRHVRITAQLIDARTDRHLWAHTYAQTLDDILTAQAELSHAIASEISAKLSPDHQMRAHLERANPQAHQSYLKARYLLDRGDESSLHKAIDMFHQALENDPQDPQSYAGLSECFISLDDFYAPPNEVMPEARSAAVRALSLDDNLGEAHTVLGAERLLYEWDWPGAETELRRGIELAPNNSDGHSWYALYFANMGRHDEALREIERAQEIDPLSAIVQMNAGWVHYLARRNDRALSQWLETLQLEPDFALSHSSIWVAYLDDSHFGEYLAHSAHQHQLDDADTLRLAVLSGNYARQGDRRQAEAYLARLKTAKNRYYVCDYELATAYAMLGNTDAAMEWLNQGYRARSSCMPNLKTDPRLDPLRADERFKGLLRTLRLDG